nr:MAG TPA: PD-(D/E)XK nuclease superfamily protein [Caudoviricetes sp.]
MGAAAHALLSASSAHRWLVCTAAPKLEETFPDTTSEYAREGTLAHEICELKLTKYVTAMAKGTYTKKLNALKKHELYQPEMLETSEAYMDYIKSVALSYPTAPAIAIERRVNFSDYAPNGFGTADCLLLAGDVLHVIDYKHGKGVVVDAAENPQMKLYALGAMHDYAMLYQFKTVKMAIVQPRVGNISEFEMGVDALLDWGKTVVRPKAQEALSAAGQFNPGEHCRFCRAKYACKARSEHFASFAELAEARADPRLLTLDELGALLHDAKLLKKWAEDLEEHALAECLEGHAVSGWKAVEGRGSRAFTDADAAFEKLVAGGVEEAVLYERRPLTLAQAEKTIGKKMFAELVGDMVVKTPGKPTLAKVSDKRPAVTNVAKAADVF